jgi:hypothetical protein
VGLRELIAERDAAREERSRMKAVLELKRRLGEHYLSFADRWAPSQKIILESERAFLFAIGGNGGGKTTLGSWWIKSELDSFNPVTGKFRERRQPVTVYAIGNTDEKVMGVMQPALRRWIPPDQLIREDRANNIWYLTEDRRVLWKTGRQDSTTFTGDEVDACWIDEELARREHWDEILARLGRRLGRCLNTFTAAEGILWMNQWIFSPDDYPMEDKTIVRISTADNPYYYDCDHCGYPKTWHEEKRKDCCSDFSNAQGQTKLERMKRQWKGIVYKIRFEGHALLLAGKPAFSPDIREKLEKEHARPPVCGYLNAATHFVHCDEPEDPRAWLRISVGKTKEGKLALLSPTPGHSYVMGVDVGGGNPTGDYHAAVVIDEETGEQCALAHTRECEPRDFGAFVAQLAVFYNNAYVVVEINNHGISVADRIIELGYGNFYRRKVVDGLTKQMTKKRGFQTNTRTKPAAVDLMVSLFYDRFKIHDPIIYAEAFHYTWLKEDRPGCHKVGNSNPDGHDDTMSALFCASIGLQERGWMIVNPKDEVAVEIRKSMADDLFEDASGRALTEDEILEGAVDSIAQDHVEDGSAPDDPFSDADPWLP